MDSKLKWGILATGKIARRFAVGLEASETGRLVAVGSRTLESAQAFAADYPCIACGSYDELIHHPEVDAVYIATPHSQHERDIIACARAGKHILCEKPFTLDFPSAQRAIEAVRSAGVFCAEAFMCRFTPDYAAIRDLIRSGRIGEPKLVRASFGFASKRGTDNFRFVRAEGGGGLMDVGSYCVQLADWVFDRPAVRSCYAMETAGDGYDAVGSGTVDYDDGLLSFSCAVHLELVNGATIFGTEGRIEMPRPWFCDQPFVVSHGSPNDPSAVVTAEPFHLTTSDLYAYEIDAVARQISSGEATEHPLTSTLRNMQTLDALRESAGLSFMPGH